MENKNGVETNNMQEILLTEKRMELANIFGKINQCIKDNLKII